MLKNWCLQTVVLEKTLEIPLDSKEIKPVNLTGNQPWMFFGRTDVEAQTSILWPPDAKNWLILKDPDLGKDWRQEKRASGDEMAGWHHQCNRRELEQTSGDGEGQRGLLCCSAWGSEESDTIGRLINNNSIWIPYLCLKYSPFLWDRGFHLPRNWKCQLLTFSPPLWSENVHMIYNLPGTSSLVPQMVKSSACSAGDPGSIPGSGRFPGKGTGSPLQYSCLGKFHGWRVRGITKSLTWLSDFAFTFTFRHLYPSLQIRS